MRIAILGATGMLGNAMFRILHRAPGHTTYAVGRSASMRNHFPGVTEDRFVSGIDVENQDALLDMFQRIQPEVVINCVGLVKQLDTANDPLQALPINALLPHRLARLCAIAGARVIQISTDCVFSGSRGSYRETDTADATDLYGRSKLMGELHAPHAITLRTSIIGHELGGHRSLIGWFLAQQGSVKGYSRAIFSGLPTVELARLIRDEVLPRPSLQGLYHVAADPIDKLSLLRLVAQTYGKEIDIIPDDSLQIDRSLNADRFRAATGYVAAPWPTLVEHMYSFQSSQGE